MKLNHPIVIVCLAYALAAAIFNISPFVVGAYMDGLAQSEAQAGFMVTAEMTVIAAIAFLLAPSISTWSHKTQLLVGLALIGIGNILSAFAADYYALLVLRIIAGSGAGFLFVYANTCIGRSGDAVRWYGFSSVSSGITGVILLAFLPWAIGLWAQNGVYYALLVFALIFLPFALSDKQSGVDETRQIQATAKVDRITPTVLVLLIVTLFIVQLTQSSYYVFVERMAGDVGLSGLSIGKVIATAYVFAIVASAMAAWLGTRWGRLLPLVLSLGLHSAAIVVTCTTQDPTLLAASVIVQTFAYFFSIPFQIGLAAELDDTGKMANIAAGIFFFGMAIGPYFGGSIIERFGYSGIAIGVVVSVIAGLLIWFRLNVILRPSLATSPS